jgi:NAD(P)H dehydrogenase (quinone)
MKVLIVLAHPEQQSMNGAMFTTAIRTLEAAGHEVKTSNLYTMGFNPVSDRSNFTSVHNAAFFKQQLEEMHATEVGGFAAFIEHEQQKVEWCDLMIWQFPLWWFSVPGILKGWVERVFAMGRFYGAGRFYADGVFKEKKAMLSFTTGGPETSYLKEGFNGDLMNILKPVHRGIFGFTGFNVLTPHIVYSPAHRSQEERAAELAKWEQRLTQVFEEEAMEVGTY